MRIKFLQSVAATAWAYLPGEVHEVPDDQAAQYITNEVAVQMLEIEATEVVGGAASRAPRREVKAHA